MSSQQKSGWLTKEGEKFKTWKKRWFELRDGIVTYAKNENDEPVSSIVLDAKCVVEESTHKGKKFCFELKTPRRTYYLTANDNDERTAWISSINDAIEGIKESTAGELFDGKPKSKITFDDFTLLKTIGKGSFGQVIQVCKKDTKKIYAMKVMNKSIIVQKNDTEHIKAERRILEKVRHPFLMTLYMSFQTPDKLYLVMRYVNGGELFQHMQSVDNFDEARTRFYVAEITLGVIYLHQMGIIYRDLKPENILLTNTGHICLTDFGISKEGFTSTETRTKTLVGTPEYLAPEVLEGKPYGKALDWWSLGTLTYEMLDGNPPFWDQDVQVMYRRILKEPLTTFPPAASPAAQDLLLRWLERDPAKRLCDATEIKQHQFFAPINWDDLYNLKVTPPYIPPVQDDISTKMIDPVFTSEDPQAAVKSSGNPADAEYAKHFEGFTFNKDEQEEPAAPQPAT